MAEQKFEWARELRSTFISTELSSKHANEIADELDARQATIDEQLRTIQALMVGMPEDGTTPVIRRIAALEQERDQLRGELESARQELHEAGERGVAFMLGPHSRVCTERDALRARLEAAEQQRPLFYVRLRSDGGYEGPIHRDSIEPVRIESGAWRPLFIDAAPVPASVSLTDEQIEASFLKCGGRWSGDAWVIEDADLHPFVRALLCTAPKQAEGGTEK